MNEKKITQVFVSGTVERISGGWPIKEWEQYTGETAPIKNTQENCTAWRPVLQMDKWSKAEKQQGKVKNKAN
jgi:hypothetical protein